MAMELELPQEIIQHIQSFLRLKEATISSVLSKPWYTTWCTRPKRSFYITHLPTRGRMNQDSPEFVRRSLQRYQSLNLKLDYVKLDLRNSINIADELILYVSNLCVNSLHLIMPKSLSYQDDVFVLPPQVFGTSSLTELNLRECKINQLIGGKILGARLVILKLLQVSIKNDIVRDILLRCPSIEKFYVDDCKYLSNINVSKKSNLKVLSVENDRCCVEYFEPGIGCYGMSAPEFQNICSLCLVKVNIGDGFFKDISLRFPRLEDLTVNGCVGYNNQEVQISSCSLKWLTLIFRSNMKLNKVELDVPNIVKFKYEGANNIPSMSFTTATSKEWESDITLRFFTDSDFHGSSRLIKLREFLLALSQSIISLNMIFSLEMYAIQLGDTSSFPLPVVEKLTLDIRYPPDEGSREFVDGLFRSFRPNFIISQYFCSWNYSDNYTFISLMYEMVKEYYSDVKVVVAELYDALMEW